MRLGVVDESYDATVYVMTAVVLESSRLAALMHDVRQLVHGHGGPPSFHANEASDHLRRGLVQLIADRGEAIQLITTVRAPVEPGRGSVEDARQRCVAELLVRMSRARVHELKFDSRDNLLRDEAGGRRTGNRRDRETLDGLKAAGEVAPTMRIIHTDDTRYQPLWLADAVVWATRRALLAPDPARIAALSAQHGIFEARRLPVRQRLRHREAPSSGLQLQLDQIQAVAARILARADTLAAERRGKDPTSYETAEAAAWRRETRTRQAAEERRRSLRPLLSPPHPRSRRRTMTPINTKSWTGCAGRRPAAE